MTIATMSAALYANTNLDTEENANKRGQMIEELTNNVEEKYADTLAVIYGAQSMSAMDEVDMDDPFYAAMKVPDSVVDELKGEG
jgi:hypothetical protein